MENTRKWSYFLFCLWFPGVLSEYGILYAKSSEKRVQDGQYCIGYSPNFKTLPTSLELAKREPLLDLTKLPGQNGFLCQELQPSPNMASKAVAVNRGNCTFVEKAKIVQSHQGDSVIVVSDAVFVPEGNKSAGDYNDVNITIALLSREDYNEIQNFHGNVSVYLYSPHEANFDYNLSIIWVLAVGTVFVGALWSGNNKHKQRLHSKASRPEDGTTEQSSDEETLDISPKYIVIFVAVMCGMIVALYFLYDYLVYVIIGIFCLASATAVYSCFLPLIEIIPGIGCRIPSNNLPCLKHRPHIKNILLALVAIGVSVFWAVERNARYAWILQDVLGVLFCIHMMKTLRLPSFMACTILLSLLFVYDIFFVFITPLFTKGNKSVMVEIATGASSTTGEQLPMVLKIPKIIQSVSTLCGSGFSLLGFGDILVPGLLISYVHAFDLKVQSKRIYLICNTIAYAVGLVLTFVGLAYMKTGQPALLYLVPCTLLTTVLIGLKRGELKHLWKGELIKPKGNGHPPNPDCENAPQPTSDNLVNEDETERSSLLQKEL